MKKVVSLETARAEHTDRGKPNHPWEVAYLSAAGVLIGKKEGVCGFPCALKKTRSALKGKGSPPVKKVIIRGDMNKAPAKFRDRFKDGCFTVTV
jgi:hypothetical protein